MESYIIMSETTQYWGVPKWKVYEVPERGTGPGPVIGFQPADTMERAIAQFEIAHQSRPWETWPHVGREMIVVLSPDWGPTERWLKEEWY